MKHSLFVVRCLGAAVAIALSVASCFPEGSGLGSIAINAGAGGEPSMTAGGAIDTGGDAGQPEMCVPRAAQDGAQCHPVQTAEPLLARAIDGVARDRTMFRDDLYKTMDSYCGACHKAPANLGGFSFSSGNFSTVVDQKVIDAITSNVQTCETDASGNKVDAKCFNFMPPAELGGKKWSERQKDANDRLTPLVRLISEWLDQGSHDTFTDAAVPGAKAPYSISADLASAFTNLGTCVPDPGMVGTEPGACDLDQRFAAMARNPTGTADQRLGLPLTLDATDLTTFDSAELARNGVVAYQPAYPLWTDDAGKLRYVRVPIGQSIKYNKKTKQFDIPANTRFYKTFMKKVKGVDGVVRYHKIETRVIVSRPRDANGNDQSLFGTYEWEDDESQANLLITPQNNGEPFVDRVKTIITDEGIAAEVADQVKKFRVRNFTYEMDSRHATRRYAFPSLQRCIQCHMGSPSQSFILGFTPLQVNVRPCDPQTVATNGHCDAGQVEPASGDEVTQVQRLRDYGVISDYADTDLVKLEDPQGTSKAPRKVRTEQELVAQGYMLGNCSHCHNPNGYPSVEHPELSPLLNFLPSAVGGIFEFPLDRYSPRIFRNTSGDGPIAYITPSLHDRFGDLAHGWVFKYAQDKGFIDAPWRSLIYRNVDTPFTYVDDSAIYPHMPLNSPGFDCRAPRILGEWMVSIPALAKHPELTEEMVLSDKVPPASTELDPQPYREVKPGDADYQNGQAQALKRLEAYRTGLRYNNYCPDTSDIVDLNVERSNGLQLIPSDGEVPGMPRENVPDRPHWVTIDLTNPPGDWNPRRGDWKQIIVDQDFSHEDKDYTQDPPVALKAPDQIALDAQKRVVALLQGVALTDSFKTFATTPVPFGVWQQKAGCKFDGVKKLGAYTGSDRSRWMDLAKFAPDGKPITPDSPVYSASPGSLVFNMICVNCHGPDADSGGRQAQTLAEMTGGTARVANFRDGLFGPFGKGGENRLRVFGSDDLAARYLPWMALGGTKVRIPIPILNLVANTPVLGEGRRGIEVRSANMLQTAQALCRLSGEVIGGPFDPIAMKNPSIQATLHTKFGELLTDIGDAELWARLCTFDNPAPIHVVRVIPDGDSFALSFTPSDNYFSSKYPTDAPVGDGQGRVQSSFTVANDTPWCVQKPDPDDAQATAWFANQVANPAKAGDPSPKLPACPDGFAKSLNAPNDVNRFTGGYTNATSTYLYGDIDDWSARGAINAGQAVFLYLDKMISKGDGRDPRYDECERLGK